MFIARNIKNAITSLDKNPGEPQLTYKGISSKKNFIGGLIGLGFLILTIILVITKGIIVWNRQKLYLTSFIQRDFSDVQLTWRQVTFTLNQKISPSQIIQINHEDYPSLGVDAVVFEIVLDSQGTHPVYLEEYPLLPCFTQLNDWLLCAHNSTHNITYNLKCNQAAIDGGICHEISQYFVVVRKCNTSNPKCSPTVAPNLIPIMMISDTKFDVLNMNNDRILIKNSVFVNAFQGIPLNQSRIYQWTVPVSKLIVESDQSIWPRSIQALSNINRTQTHFIPTQNILLNQFIHLNALMNFNIIRSGFTESYTRSFGRFDEMLGQIFGLIGLMSLIATCFCAGYNQWRMTNFIKANIENSITNNDDELQKDESKMEEEGLLSYMKQSVKKVGKICKKYDKQLNKQLDILKLYKDVQKIKSILGDQYFKEEVNRASMDKQEQNRCSASEEKITEKDILTEQLISSKTQSDNN